MGWSSERLMDNQGHAWPVTGYWCDMCGMPLHSILRGSGVHPGCDVQRRCGARNETCIVTPFQVSSQST